MTNDTDTDGIYYSECACGWSLERDKRAANLPMENNEEITRKVESIHISRPRFGDAENETHEIIDSNVTQ